MGAVQEDNVYYGHPSECKMNCKLLFHFVSILTVTLFTQCFLFHLIYVSMAAIAAPVEVGSLLLYYCTSIFCLISFGAVILKVLIRSIQECIPEKLGCFSLLLILLSIILLGGLVVFGTFLYYYTTLNQEYRNSRGMLTFLGALFPSLIATVVGIFLTSIISCVEKNTSKQEEHKKKDKKEVSEQEEEEVSEQEEQDDSNVPNTTTVTVEHQND